MIRYSLCCANGHAFESWFRNSAAFDRQATERRIVCPHCGSAKVEKAVMAPNVAGRGRVEEPPPNPNPAREKELRRLRQLARRLRDHVVENADYVGPRFPEEARKIHHEEAEQRGIYGEATVEEARELTEEGIPVHPLPVLPEDRN